jgi:superfamily II DNA/RNA helicase
VSSPASLQAEGRGKTVVSPARSGRQRFKLVEELNDRGFNAAAAHGGDFTRSSASAQMAAFRLRQRKHIPIATDVAARGIDVKRRYLM